MTATVPALDRSTSTAATTLAAVGAAGVCVAFAGLQVALAAGAPCTDLPCPGQSVAPQVSIGFRVSEVDRE